MTEYITMKVRARRSTDLAVLLVVHEYMPEEKEIWVPKSVMECALDADETKIECTVYIEQWWLDITRVSY